MTQVPITLIGGPLDLHRFVKESPSPLLEFPVFERPADFRPWERYTEDVPYGFQRVTYRLVSRIPDADPFRPDHYIYAHVA